jgi:hypothetical protein
MIRPWISRPLDFSSPPNLRHYLIYWAEGIGYVERLTQSTFQYPRALHPGLNIAETLRTTQLLRLFQ